MPTDVNSATITRTYIRRSQMNQPTSSCAEFWLPMRCYATRLGGQPTTALIQVAPTPALPG